MAFSITGIAYLLTFFSTGFLTYRFFQYWREERTVVARLFLYFMATFSIFFIVTTLPSLFFAKNTLALKGVVISTAFLEGLAAAFIGYLIIYLKFPKISPWLGFFVPLFLGSAATLITLFSSFEPFLETDLSINWGYQGPAYIFRNLVYLLTFLPMLFLLIGQFRKRQADYAKARALGLIVVFAFVIIVVIFDYGVEKALGLKAVSSDIFQEILSIFLFIFLVLTQKSPAKKRVAKIYEEPPQD